MSNRIADIVGWWTRHGPNPLLTAGLVGAGVYGIGRAAYGPAKSLVRQTAKALGRPFSRKLGMGKAFEDAMRRMEAEDRARRAEIADAEAHGEDPPPDPNGSDRWKVPAGLAGLSALAALYHFWDPRDGYRSLFKWRKTASFGMDDQFGMAGGVVSDLDWKKPISVYEAAPLFGSDPFLKDDPYTRNMGISILSSAAQREGSAYPTTGAVFDSAVEKMRSKLTLGGVVQTGIKTVVSNGLAQLFTGALGTMVDLDKNTRDNLVSAGTWAGAISSILH